MRGQKGEYRDLFESLQRQGYARARVDGKVYRLSEVPALQRQQKHEIEVVVTRYSPETTPRTTVADGVSEALKLGENTLVVIPWDEQAEKDRSEIEANEEKPKASRRRASKQADSDLVLSSQYAVLNAATPACHQRHNCSALIARLVCAKSVKDWASSLPSAPELIIPDPTMSLKRGAIELLGPWNDLGRWQRHQ